MLIDESDMVGMILNRGSTWIHDDAINADPPRLNGGERIIIMKLYFVVINRAEHSGFMAEEESSDVRTRDNEWGWTNQSVEGGYGHIYHECTDKSEAQGVLDRYLECDSVENGTYCYSHNPTYV